jgi:hypothetical protein
MWILIILALAVTACGLVSTTEPPDKIMGVDTFYQTPIKYPRDPHQGIEEVDCSYCHTKYADSTRTAVPSQNATMSQFTHTSHLDIACSSCHKENDTDSLTLIVTRLECSGCHY